MSKVQWEGYEIVFTMKTSLGKIHHELRCSFNPQILLHTKHNNIVESHLEKVKSTPLSATINLTFSAAWPFLMKVFQFHCDKRKLHFHFLAPHQLVFHIVPQTILQQKES